MAVSQYSDLISSAEGDNGLPPGLMTAVLSQESGGDPNAVSSAGAQGVAQLMPATARGLGVTDPTDPSQAIPAAGRYLRQQYDRFGDWGSALAAYNAGPARVARSLQQTGDIPDVTQGYVSQVVDRMASRGIPAGGAVQPADAPADDDPGLSPSDIQSAVQGGAYTADRQSAGRVPDIAGAGASSGGSSGSGGSQGGAAASPADNGASALAPPIPGVVQDPRDANVWRKADGSIGYLGPGGQQTFEQNADGSVAILITGTSNPTAIREYLGRHPEMAGLPKAAGQGMGDAAADQLTPDEINAALANGYSVDPNGPVVGSGQPGSKSVASPVQPVDPQNPLQGLLASFSNMGGGDPGALQGPLDGILRSADSTVRGLANGMTFGLADKAAALDQAFPALFNGGLPALQQAYSANMDRQQQRDAADNRDLPLSSLVSRVAGGVVPAAFLPEVGASSLLGRAAVGAGQGALLGGLDAGGNARGSLLDMAKASTPGLIWGGALGAPLGAVVGARAAGELPANLASLADYTRSGVEPMLAVDGGRSLQQVGQWLKGTPIVGAPLAEAATRSQGQVRSALENIAGRYGTASNLEEAGAPIMAANNSSVGAVQAQRTSLSDRVGQLAQQYGAGAGRRVVGENVQDAVGQFARGGDLATAGAGALPVRSTSFADKSADLYDQAFNRLDNEMSGGVRGTGTPLDLSPAPSRAASTASATAPGAAITPMDQALNIIRSGKTVRPNSGPSLMDFVAQNGGLHDQGGEVSAMDGDLWHRDLSHTGATAFRRKIIQPNGLGLEDMAQRASDAGYFPDAQTPSWSSSDNTQGVGSQDLLDAMRGELDRVPGRGVAWRHSRHDLRQRRAGQTATAGRLTRGSSLKGATLSTVM